MRKTCDVKDCNHHVGFRGFGRELCWRHYSDWVLSFRASDSLRESERHPQKPLDFTGHVVEDGVQSKHSED